MQLMSCGYGQARPAVSGAQSQDGWQLEPSMLIVCIASMSRAMAICISPYYGAGGYIADTENGVKRYFFALAEIDQMN